MCPSGSSLLLIIAAFLGGHSMSFIYDTNYELGVNTTVTYRHGSCSRNCILSLFFTPAPPVDEVCLLTHPHVPLPLGFPNPSDRQKAQVL